MSGLMVVSPRPSLATLLFVQCNYAQHSQFTHRVQSFGEPCPPTLLMMHAYHKTLSNDGTGCEARKQFAMHIAPVCFNRGCNLKGGGAKVKKGAAAGGGCDEHPVRE